MKVNGQDFQFAMEAEVHSFQVSPEGKISTYALADWFQEIAWRHANSAGFGTNLSENRQMWALARLSIKAAKRPAWGEKMKIYTAGRGVNKIFAFREFLLTDLDGNPLVTGMSSWLLLDSVSKRPQRPESVLPRELFDPELKPMWEPEKVQAQGEIKNQIRIQVKPSDLDLNRHVNNTSYIRWAEDLIIQAGIDPKFCGINYLSECHLNDEVTLELSESAGEFFVEGKVKEKRVFSSHWA